MDITFENAGSESIDDNLFLLKERCFKSLRVSSPVIF